MKNVALIMAAGSSQRCGFDKLLAELGSTTVLERCVQTFLSCDLIDEIWVVGKTKVDLGFKVDLESKKIKGFLSGGATRFQSLKAGLSQCQSYYPAKEKVRIIVHNAANPHLFKVDLEKGIKLAEQKQNVIFGFFSPNAIKQVGTDGRVEAYLDRARILETQTPQISTLSTFTKALEAWEQAAEDTRVHKDEETTEPRDEAELLALIDEPVFVYECDSSNTKITFPNDLPISVCHPEFISGSLEKSTKIINQVQHDIKIGLGEDSHHFAAVFDVDKPFRLGGVDVSEGRLSSDGNSDGDVILHALCNSLLSAHGDKTFDPIAAPLCAAGDTNSALYLTATLEHLANNHSSFTIHQVLITLEGAQPKIAPHHETIVGNLAKLLNLKPRQIGLTYTSGEGLNACGRGEGMRSYILVTLT